MCRSLLSGTTLRRRTPNIETSRYDKLARNIFRARGSRRGLSVDRVTIDRGVDVRVGAKVGGKVDGRFRRVHEKDSARMGGEENG